MIIDEIPGQSHETIDDFERTHSPDYVIESPSEKINIADTINEKNNITDTINENETLIIDEIPGQSHETIDDFERTNSTNNFLIFFNKYVYFKPSEKKYIFGLLKALEIENEKFRILATKYKKVLVVKGIHTDRSECDNTIHFNIKFPDTNEFYAYIENNKITSITEIVNII